MTHSHKAILGSKGYEISLEGNIRKRGQKTENLPVINGKVTLSIYDRVCEFDVAWLALMAHFEYKNCTDYFNVYFVDYPDNGNVKTIAKKIMRFVKPVMVNKTHRLIPGFTQYAISKTGNIIELKSGCEIKVKNAESKSSYPTCFIRDPDISNYRHIVIHRLVALAWVNNDDFVEKPIVNHKNGNKLNYNHSNLEWVSYSNNINHAFNSGLRSDNIPYKVRNIETGEIKNYRSFRSFCLEHNLHPTLKFKKIANIRKYGLVKEKYQVKELNDNSPWENVIPNAKRGKYTVTVTMPSGEIEIFYNIVDIMKKLKLWNISYNIKAIEEKAKSKFPGIKFDVKTLYETKEVQAYKIQTGEIFEAESVRQLGKILNIHYSTINTAISLGETHISNGFAFRFKTNIPWNTKFTYSVKSKIPVKAVNLITKEVINFPSIKKAAEFFNREHSTTRYYLENNIPLNEWMLYNNRHPTSIGSLHSNV